MSFVAPSYYLLLGVAALLYYAVSGVERKKQVLVFASILFAVLFHWVSGLFLAAFTATNFWLLRSMAAAPKGARRRWYRGALLGNIGLLLVYKLALSLNAQFGTGQPGFWQGATVILGLSFYGLQQIGYYIEVYQKNLSFTTSFTDYFLSLAFFPKLTEGPILKWQQPTGITNLEGAANWESNLSYGIQRILLGLFKKLALADRLAPYVAHVFDDHNTLSGLHIYVGALLFTVQMYLDFSGFIDIALGSARVFGVRLPENFNLPLRAVSVVDFWRRWHITLIDWLTTYVFYPVSYRYRKMKGKGLLLAVAATFLVSAAWHGLALTFLVWGVCHILYLAAEHRFFPKAATGSKKGWQRAVKIFIVINLVSFANIFFRSGSMADAGQLFADLARLPFWLPEGVLFKTWLLNGGQDIEMEFNYRLSLALCFGFLLLERRITTFALSDRYRIGYVTLALVLLVVFGYFSGGEQFVYNNF